MVISTPFRLLGSRLYRETSTKLVFLPSTSSRRASLPRIVKKNLSCHLLEARSAFEFLQCCISKLTWIIMTDNRFCVEYAKSGRSSCKKCKQQIEKGMGRIGKLTANPFSEDGGDMKVWYHMRCVFETFKVCTLPTVHR